MANGMAREALEPLERAIGRSDAAGGNLRPLNQARLAAAYLLQGDHARALETAERAVADATRTGHVARVHAELSRARALAASGGLAAASDALDRVEHLIRQVGADGMRPHLALARAELARHQGDAAAEQALKEQAAAEFEACEATERARLTRGRGGVTVRPWLPGSRPTLRLA